MSLCSLPRSDQIEGKDLIVIESFHVTLNVLCIDIAPFRQIVPFSQDEQKKGPFVNYLADRREHKHEYRAYVKLALDVLARMISLYCERAAHRDRLHDREVYSFAAEPLPSSSPSPSSSASSSSSPYYPGRVCDASLPFPKTYGMRGYGMLQAEACHGPYPRPSSTALQRCEYSHLFVFTITDLIDVVRAHHVRCVVSCVHLHVSADHL